MTEQPDEQGGARLPNGLTPEQDAAMDALVKALVDYFKAES